MSVIPTKFVEAGGAQEDAIRGGIGQAIKSAAELGADVGDAATKNEFNRGVAEKDVGIPSDLAEHGAVSMMAVATPDYYNPVIVIRLNSERFNVNKDEHKAFYKKMSDGIHADFSSESRVKIHPKDIETLKTPSLK